MIDPDIIAAGVHTKINQYQKRAKVMRCAVVGTLAACLCAFAFLELSDIFGTALPAVGQRGAQALNDAGSPVGAAVTCGGKTFTLEGAAQDDYMLYLLLTTEADTETLDSFSFILRSAALTQPPASYLSANCGFAFYQAAAGGQPGRILLTHIKTLSTGSSEQLSLWIRSQGEEVAELQSLTFGLEQIAKAAEITLDVEFTTRSGEVWKFEKLVLTPFCARLISTADSLPSQFTERYPCEIITQDTTLTANAHWFADGKETGLILEWQAALSPQEVTSIVLNGTSICWQ